ncbi:MAG: hypothetical protein ACK4K9_08410 [Bacteroidia bacterium]
MKTLIYIIAILLLFAACSKPEPIESNPTITYHRLKTEQLNKTPYFTNPDFDTLTYLSNKGDTLIFAKLKTDTTWYYIRTQGAPGVTLNEDYYQTLRNTYQTLKGNGKFEVRHSKNGIAFDRNLSDFITISFNNFNYYINDYFLGVNHIIIIDSIIFDNKKYFQVTRFFNNWTDSISTEAYINKDYGIFRIEDKILLNNWDLK